MQIVIKIHDIPQNDHERWALKNGTPLPKGHGRLIDAEKLAKEINRAWTLWEKKGEDCYLFSDVITPMLVSQQTVIEADEGSDSE